MTATIQPATAVAVTRCATCETDLQGQYCHGCGEKKRHESELSLKHFALHALHELTHLDSKVFATVRNLFTRPGFLTQEYIAGRRSVYMKPLSLFLLACALLFLVDSFFPRSAYDVNWVTHQDKTGKVDAAWTKLAAKKHLPKEILVERIQTTIHKISTGMQFANVIVLAGILALLYLKRYFVEHLVFAFHYMSLTYLASAVFRPITSLFAVYSWTSYLISGAFTIAYLVYLFIALRRVYRESAGFTLIKSLATLVVAFLVLIFTQMVTLIAAVIA